MEYDGLHTICFICGHSGHMQDILPINVAKHMETQGHGCGSAVNPNSEGNDTIIGKSCDFGDWMVVRKRGRCGPRTDFVGNIPQGKNKFAVFDD